MTIEILSALAAFAFVTSITPGPNNLMLMASGVNFGFHRTIPHMLGVGIGFMIMIVVIGLGLSELLHAWPLASGLMKAASAGYLLFLAWKLSTASPPDAAQSTARPLTFLQAALFQWVNPKAWAMALTAITAYAPSGSMAAIALVAAVFGAINLPAVSSWTVLGQQLRRQLADARRRRLFNRLMALTLLVSSYPLFLP